MDPSETIIGWHVTPKDPKTFTSFKSAHLCCPAVWFWIDRETAEEAHHYGDHIIEAEIDPGRQKTVDFESEEDDRNALGEAELAREEGYDSLLIINAFDGTIYGDQLAILKPEKVLQIRATHYHATKQPA